MLSAKERVEVVVSISWPHLVAIDKQRQNGTRVYQALIVPKGLQSSTRVACAGDEGGCRDERSRYGSPDICRRKLSAQSAARCACSCDGRDL